ncbi:hypothetical protein EIP91_010578 [Steccherinum ochraceum]|uniref:F-box domain-containing protein n=1 Tax=Steccherinum ochraceum TaxID=92696 RepID=A0A4R0RMX2_9APHY|nr:hypothetical protein EIP91_010578 [Steccherinum ochraceum]
MNLKISRWFMKKFFVSSKRARARPLPELPHDVVLYVVKHLQDDSLSLKACTFVNRTWREAAQPLMFRSIAVTGPTRLLQLEKLATDTPSVTSWIKRLDIDRSLTDRGISIPGSQHPSWFFDLGSKLADKLHNLTVLHFSHVTDDTLKPTPGFFHFISVFKQVKHVTFDDCNFTDPVFFAFIASFPGLEHLRIRNHHRHAVVGPDVPYLFLPKLRSLRVELPFNAFDTIIPFLLWLGGTQSVYTLRSVSFQNVSGTLPMDGSKRVAAHVGDLLQKCVHLEHLALTAVDKNEASRVESDAAFVSHFNFSHNTRLHTISLKDPADGAIIPLLLKTTIDIRNINIILDAPPSTPTPPDGFVENHSAIVSLLETPAFAGVREVKVVNPKKALGAGAGIGSGKDELVKRVYKSLLDTGLVKMVEDSEEEYAKTWGGWV